MSDILNSHIELGHSCCHQEVVFPKKATGGSACYIMCLSRKANECHTPALLQLSSSGMSLLTFATWLWEAVTGHTFYLNAILGTNHDMPRKPFKHLFSPLVSMRFKRPFSSHTGVFSFFFQSYVYRLLEDLVSCLEQHKCTLYYLLFTQSK